MADSVDVPIVEAADLDRFLLDVGGAVDRQEVRLPLWGGAGGGLTRAVGDRLGRVRGAVATATRDFVRSR